MNDCPLDISPINNSDTYTLVNKNTVACPIVERKPGKSLVFLSYIDVLNEKLGRDLVFDTFCVCVLPQTMHLQNGDL